MTVVKKIELSIDLTKPADELIETIISVLSFYPGRQHEILEKVDHTVGEMLAAIQPKEEPEPKEKLKEST
ncbi:hypothetical protein [Paenibacillus graminis]|uniref:Uncharacterized protein n=1 Tax=Paenibacillus graminis TaxID=189425 RepID=A0A089M971_9BACL|nr:hypothetical protein [Paenibacillus graminis]AIQ70351.1 hypothetical protein PGRAT_23975 [Paenibacillus graminis]MEC0169708.1 hypothetical protein [Paenibacillus graminis]